MFNVIWLNNLFWVVVGMLVGLILIKLMRRTKTVGTLRVDRSDPTEPPYLFLELAEPLEEWMDENYVLMQVKFKNYISQK